MWGEAVSTLNQRVSAHKFPMVLLQREMSWFQEFEYVYELWWKNLFWPHKAVWIPVYQRVTSRIVFLFTNMCMTENGGLQSFLQLRIFSPQLRNFSHQPLIFAVLNWRSHYRINVRKTDFCWSTAFIQKQVFIILRGERSTNTSSVLLMLYLFVSRLYRSYLDPFHFWEKGGAKKVHTLFY